MKDNEYLDQVLAELESTSEDWEELFKGEFHLQEVFNLTASLVMTVESIVAVPSSGEEKHKLVRDAFEHFDRKFHIIDRMDDLIPLPFFLEPFDGPFLRKLVDFLIGQAVTVFNQTLWGEAPSE